MAMAEVRMPRVHQQDQRFVPERAESPRSSLAVDYMVPDRPWLSK